VSTGNRYERRQAATVSYVKTATSSMRASPAITGETPAAMGMSGRSLFIGEQHSRDRIVRNAYRLKLDGPSTPKTKAANGEAAMSGPATDEKQTKGARK
jgi:hypothetical protein